VAVASDRENGLLWDEELLSVLGDNIFQQVMLYILSLSDLDRREIRRIFSKVENKELRSKTISVAG